MSMPKKGRRTIVVDGDTYYYKIRAHTDCWGTDLTLVFECPDSKVHSKTFPRSTKYAAFTPKDVEREIRNTMIPQSKQAKDTGLSRLVREFESLRDHMNNTADIIKFWIWVGVLFAPAIVWLYSELEIWYKRRKKMSYIQIQQQIQQENTGVQLNGRAVGL